MESFKAYSESSKKILNIAQMSTALPVNVIITGDEGVGKKLLANHALPDGAIFQADVLEKTLLDKNFTLDEHKQIIVTHFEKVINKKEFMDKLDGIKVVATSLYLPSDVEANFAIKIDVPALKQRTEDLENLIDQYVKEASSIYKCEILKSELDIDLSKNGISLKESIYKNSLLSSLTQEDINKALNIFFKKKLKEGEDYKDLLEFFEIPLLDAAKEQFKSQLQMASHLNINRMTLRKKIAQYGLD